MMGHTTLKHIRPYPRLLAPLLVLAVLLRACIPVGYMPSTDKSKGISLSLCVTGLSTPTIVYLDLPHHTPHLDHPALDCAFGVALGFLGPVQTNLTWLADVFPPLLFQLQAHRILFRKRIVSASLGARGPPSSS